MDGSIERLFGTSVQEAVQRSLTSNKALFVFLSKGDLASDEFVRRFFFREDEIDGKVIQMLTDHYVCLKLKENTSDMAFFCEIFKNIVLPSFYIVRKGQLVHMITESMSPEEFSEKLAHECVDSKNNRTPATSSVNNTDVPSREGSVKTSRTLSDDGNATKKQRSVSASPPREDVISKTKLKNKTFNRSLEVETERIRSLLKADQKERDSLKRERNLFKESSSGLDQSKQNAKSDMCILSIRLFDGNALKHDFKPSQTLNDVRSWLDTETNDEIISNTSSMPSFAHSSYPQPTRYAFHRPSLPRITYSDEQEFKTLLELELCPRSVLILKPIYDDKGFSNSYPDGKSANQGLFTTMGSALGKVGNALYSFFDYGVDDEVNLHRDEYSENSESPVVEDIGSTSGHNNYVNSFARDDYFQPREESTTDRSTPNILSIDNVRASSSSLINLGPHHNNVNEAIESNEVIGNVGIVGTSRKNSPKPMNIRSGVQTLQNGVEEEKSNNDIDS